MPGSDAAKPGRALGLVGRGAARAACPGEPAAAGNSRPAAAVEKRRRARIPTRTADLYHDGPKDGNPRPPAGVTAVPLFTRGLFPAAPARHSCRWHVETCALTRISAFGSIRALPRVGCPCAAWRPQRPFGFPLLKAFSIFSGNAHRGLAEAMCRHLETRLGQAQVTRFADGEVYVEIQENVRGVNCFVVQPTSTPVNDNLMELLVMIDALKRASAGSHHRRHPLLRLRPPGPQDQAAHADLGPAGRRSADRGRACTACWRSTCTPGRSRASSTSRSTTCTPCRC